MVLTWSGALSSLFSDWRRSQRSAVAGFEQWDESGSNVKSDLRVCFKHFIGGEGSKHGRPSPVPERCIWKISTPYTFCCVTAFLHGIMFFLILYTQQLIMTWKKLFLNNVPEARHAYLWTAHFSLQHLSRSIRSAGKRRRINDLSRDVQPGWSLGSGWAPPGPSRSRSWRLSCV